MKLIINLGQDMKIEEEKNINLLKVLNLFQRKTFKLISKRVDKKGTKNSIWEDHNWFNEFISKI